MKIITGIFIVASVLSLSACGTTGTVNSATSSAMIGAAAGYVYGKQVEAQRQRQYQNNGYGY